MEDAIATSTEERSPTKPSVAVVTRIADREETNPIELRPPLYSVIDPEALDSLFSASSTGISGSNGTISFTYCGYDVCIDSDAEITITEA